MIRLLPLLMLLLLGLAGPAAAMVRLPENPLPIAGNPADRLLSVPIEDSVYDLHAENRAIDWHLDASVRTDKRAAERLVRLLLAPDAAGNPQALARRMGVEELIWDCGYWGAGMTEFDEYGPCYGKRGKLKRKVNKTSFWSRGR